MAEIGRTEQPNPAKAPPTSDDPNRRQDGAKVNQSPNRIEGQAESPSDVQRRQEEQRRKDEERRQEEQRQQANKQSTNEGGKAET